MVAPAAFVLRRPVVVHVRGEMRMRRWHQLVLAAARANVHVSQTLAATHLGRCDARWAGRIARRGHVVYNGIDIAAVRAHERTADRSGLRRHLGVHAGDVVVLSVGALHPWKGQLELVREVLPRVVANAPATRFLLAGGASREHVDGTGDYSRALREAAHDAGDRVVLLGYRPDIYDLLVAADLSALASTSEGLARFLVESAAFGRPIVTFAGIGAEIVDDRTSGILVAPADYGAFADALTELVLDSGLRAEYGAAARRLASDRFDTAIVAPQMEQVFDTARAS
jgi:glycosyltransferase involved in cell wall biosynthesis